MSIGGSLFPALGTADSSSNPDKTPNEEEVIVPHFVLSLIAYIQNTSILKA